MGWAVGFDSNWKRDIGYGVPTICDDPTCNKAIDRGIAYVCGGHPYGGDHGCGLFFCGHHMYTSGEGMPVCVRCRAGLEPYTPKPDLAAWCRHKLTDPSWEEWRQQNPKEVQTCKQIVLGQYRPKEKKMPPHINKQHIVEIEYTNYRGEKRKRKIIPIHTMEFRTTEYYPEAQWLFTAFDLSKNDYRTFAFKNISSWTPAPEGE